MNNIDYNDNYCDFDSLVNAILNDILNKTPKGKEADLDLIGDTMSFPLKEALRINKKNDRLSKITKW